MAPLLKYWFKAWIWGGHKHGSRVEPKAVLSPKQCSDMRACCLLLLIVALLLAADLWGEGYEYIRIYHPSQITLVVADGQQSGSGSV